MAITGGLALALGASVGPLVVGALIGAALGIAGGRLVLHALRVRPRRRA
ncbi:MAG: hypothetical protein U0Q07_16645 [Acidimicrobiales bacterium]